MMHVKYLWGVIIITLAATFGSWLFGLAVGAIFERAPFAPLYGPGYDEPQTILSPEAIDGLAPSLRPGDTLITTATKCSHEGGVSVSGTVTLRKLEPPPIPNPVQLFTVSRSIQTPGCETRQYATVVPDLPPGLYELVGVEVASKGSDEQYIVWHTAPFEVVSDER